MHAGLVALTVWPLLHIYLVKRYDLSPWKLFGWGMYATPRFADAGMEVYGRRRDGGGFEHLSAPAPSLRGPGIEFLNRYKWLRGLASSDAFARDVLALHPEWDQVKIVVSRPELVASTGMVVMKSDERLYPTP